MNLCSFIHRPSEIVLGLGEAGKPDDRIVTYYGTVHKVENEFWMWYLGQGSTGSDWHQRMCLAKSRDGRHWERPNLGLVEYNGTKENNLIDLCDGDHISTAVVFYDPNESRSERRFKMLFESWRYERKMAVAYSSDGIRWTEYTKNPVGPMLEMSGGTSLDGAYYVNGQGGVHWSPGDWSRKLATFVSYDFEHWTEASCMGFRRDPLPPRPTEYSLLQGPDSTLGAINGKQVHLGAALWNRGNVIIGFYGAWNGHPSCDRRHVWMNLGLLVSHDALHFHEPIPDFPIVACSELGYGLPPSQPEMRYSALVQGQGFANVGAETLFWYAPWPQMYSDGIRLATWERDRLGCLQPYTGPDTKPHLISAAIETDDKPVNVSLNVDGITSLSNVRVSILDEGFRELPDFSADDCLPMPESGLGQKVKWENGDIINTDHPVRIRVDFCGPRPEDVKLYAIYVEHKESAVALETAGDAD